MIVRARTLLPMSAPPIEDGAVVVEGALVTDVGSFREIRAAHFGSEVVDLGEQVLLPGLINAHCHLDYTIFKGLLNPGKGFTKWVGRINALKRGFDDDELLRSIDLGFAELIRWGTTTVLNIESFPELMVERPTPPIRTWWFLEMMDIRHRDPTEDVVAGTLRFFEKNDRGGYGLSPHAPYTASAELYRLADECARKLDMPLSTHLAESSEEDAMFRENAGPMADFMRSLGRPMEDCDGCSAFGNLARRGAIGSDWIVVHLNELDDSDFALIETRPELRRLHVVHCPQSHRFFAHRPFQLERLRRMGANVSLGTDSLASGESLSLFDEMRILRESEPTLRPRELLEMTTLNPAMALRHAGRLGEISPGAYADLIALPFSASLDSLYDEILEHRAPIRWMMSHGQIVD